jgi:hypothetical protein
MRILQYCERNELIDKLPYSRGTALLRITNEDKTKIRTRAILPTEYLNNIFNTIYTHTGEEEDEVYFFVYISVIRALLWAA